MSRSHLAGIVLVAGAMLWVGVAAQQEVQPRPGFGTGVMTVNVLNRPAVLAEQIGDWQVSISRLPDVRLAHTATVSVQLPRFAAKGGKYLVTWSTGETEKIVIGEAGEDGWILVDNAGRPGQRWVNLRSARSLEEQK